jgi:hypothetical protein
MAAAVAVMVAAAVATAVAGATAADDAVINFFQKALASAGAFCFQTFLRRISNSPRLRSLADPNYLCIDINI